MGYNIGLQRSIAVSDFILQDNGHNVLEAAEEFNLSKTTIERDLKLLGVEAFYGIKPNIELQKKYKMVQIVLKRLAIQNQKKTILEKEKS